MKVLGAILWLLATSLGAAQQPPIRVNVLNVCGPAEAEQKEIAAALARVPRRPTFAADFEIARGRSTPSDAPVSRWVRIRREFRAESPFINAQYSFSVDEKGAVETLVLRLREPKDLMQIAIEDSSPGGSAASLLGATAAAGRIRLERFGKSSVALVRCPQVDQSAYEPLFRAASEIMNGYRSALSVQRTVPADLARVGAAGDGSSASAKQKK